MQKNNKYAIAEMFYSIQGEGYWTGTIRTILNLQ